MRRPNQNDGVVKKQLASAPLARGVTVLGKRIATFMAEGKVRGNVKDYVLFVGDQMIDNWGQYTIRRTAEGAGLMALVHKRDLHKVIGAEAAARFWHRRLGKRTNYGAPPASQKAEPTEH